MNWDYLFTYSIAHRGRQYYKQNRVVGLTGNGTVYEAWVEGSEDYYVTINLTDFHDPEMSCTCPYATNGLNCKHMAAVLTAIEKEDVFGLWQENKNNINRAGTGVKTPAPVSRVPGTGSSRPAAGAADQEISRRQVIADSKKQVYPFGQDPDLLWEIGASDRHEFRYFDLARITKDQTFFKKKVDDAERNIREGLVKLQQLETGYETGLDRKNLVATAHGTAILRGIEWKTTLAFNKDKLLKTECLVPGCSCNNSRNMFRSYQDFHRADKGELCVHLTALLLLTDQKLQEFDPGDTTDYTANRMLEAFRTRRSQREAEARTDLQMAPLCLEPRLSREHGMLFLSFRVGTDKMYVVKNLTELVDCIDHQKKMEIGTKTVLDPALHGISTFSRKYYDFIADIVHLEEGRNRYSERYPVRYEDISERIRNSIPLYGRRLDQFFEIAAGSSLELIDKRQASGKTKIKFRDYEPKAEMKISAQSRQGSFLGVEVSGSIPRLMEGERYYYNLTEHHLNRIDPSVIRKMQPLLDMADVGDNFSFTVGKNNLSEFYYRVLPVLENCADIEQPDRMEIESYLPPDVSFLFRLDNVNRDAVCSAWAEYGDTEYLLERENTASQAGVRDARMEEEVRNLLKKLFPQRGTEPNCYCCGGDSDRIYYLLEQGLRQLMEYGEVQTTAAFKSLRIRKSAKLTVGVSVESNLMNLEILSTDLSREELLDILYHYKNKKKYYRLKNGDFLSLEQENLQELASMMETLQISPKEFVKGKMQLPLYRALYLNKMLEENDSLYADRDSRFRKLVKEFKTISDNDFEVPETLSCVMRNYQIYGYKWLRTLDQIGFGGILADDMGLGKTIQTIAVLLTEKHRNREAAGSTVSLVVCPASLVFNWQEECRRFAPELDTCIIAGTQEERKELLKDWDRHDLLITSYDLLKRDIDQYEGKEFRYQIIDEAQYIKNHTTAAAKAVKVIKSRTRYALTGTPIENRLSELWSIFDFLMPGFLYTYENFKREYESPITKYQDAESTRQLKRMVTPFILRRLKSDVLKDLPEKLEEVRYAHMAGEQQKLYDAQVVHMKQMLEEETAEEFGSSKIQILAELTKIRQICCDPSLLKDNYRGESAKREACMDLVRSAIAGEHKMLIFSQFTSMLELLEADLKKEGIPYYKIIGATPKEKRLEMVREFNADDTPVFLISLKAGGTGLNLTGADIVIHYDPWWNVAAQNQATDRTHRIGQTKTVFVFRLVVKDTIEERILEMQETKKNLAEEILSGENSSLSSLSKDELLSLFNS